MLVRSQVKYIQSLALKKFRDAEGVFVAEGPKLVTELLALPNTRPVAVFATTEFTQNELPAGPTLTIISQSELGRLSLQAAPNQVLAIFAKPVFDEPVFEKKLCLMLDGVQDPGNLGTIVRTADWFGLRDIVCSPDTADLFGPKTVQATMGSIGRVAVHYTDLPSFVRAHPGLDYFATSPGGAAPISFREAAAGMIVIGSEGRGIGTGLLEMIGGKLTIPRYGGAESLNAAIATAIILAAVKNV